NRSTACMSMTNFSSAELAAKRKEKRRRAFSAIRLFFAFRGILLIGFRRSPALLHFFAAFRTSFFAVGLSLFDLRTLVGRQNTHYLNAYILVTLLHCRMESF